MMRTLSQYINEKLSFGDKVLKFFSTLMFGNTPTQDEYVKQLKRFVEMNSNNNVSITIKRLRELRRDIGNVINADLGTTWLTWPATDFHNQKQTVREMIVGGTLHNGEIELFDETPFVCFYAKGSKKYVVDFNSVYYLSVKTEDGNRPLKAIFDLNDTTDGTYGGDVKNYVIPLCMNPDDELKRIWDEYEEDKGKLDVDVKHTIAELEQEIQKLKQKIDK